MSQQQSFNPDSFKTKGENSDREPAPTDSQEEAELFRLYYRFGDHVSKPKHTSGFILPVDGCSVLELAASVGYDSCKRSNLQVLDSHTLLFIAGSYLRIYKTDTQEETYIRCTGDGSVNCIAVAQKYPAFASGEKGTKPDINIFGYPSCRLRKILKNGTEKEYVSMMFDPISGDLLASLGGEPDYNLTIWHWQKEVPLLRRKAFSQDVYKVAFSDDLFGCLVTSGLGHIRFWTMAVTFTGLKLNGAIGRFGVHEPSNIEAFLSFPDGKVISGSEEGIMYLWEEALLKAKFTSKGKDYCHRGKITQMFMFEGEILTLGEDGYIRTWSVDDVIYVEPDFHGERFHLNALQEVLVDEHAYLMHMVPAKPKNPESYDWYAQDKVGRVWSVDLSITMNARPPRAELQFHAGPVIACAASLNTHLVATAGQDGAVRIFDCLQKKELMSMKFSAPASSLLWVPLSVDREGASVIAGFADGIVRKIVFCGEKVPENTEKKELRKLEGKLSQVFKAHEDRVTSMTFSHKGDIFVSGSMDKTMFFFRLNNTEFIALGWLSVPTSVKQLVWTPFQFVYQGLLAVCDDGIVVQIRERHLFFNVELTPTLQFLHPRLQLFKFQSIKSEIQHAEKIDRLKKEIAEKKKKEKAEKSEEGGEEQTEPDEEEIKKEVEEHKLVQKEEENWQPYYPDSPSPILQAVYSKQEDCFWLTLGEYDAGYIYRCRFSQTQYQDVPEIVMFARGKDKDTFMDMSSSELFSIDDISALQEEVNMIVSLEADFEESLIEGFLSDLMEEFDNKLRALYKERAELDVLLKQADLLYISKLEEFLLSEKTFIEEMELMDGIAEKTQELKRTQTASLNLRKQIVKKTEESELISKQLSELWLEFQKLCEDKSGTRMWRFLARLFKRKKAKEKIVTDDEDEDEEMSESESFSTVSSDLESDASVSLDLNYCPEELEPVLYVDVLEMQTQHQNLDEQLNETKQDLIHLAKDLEQAAKDIEIIKREQEKIQQRVDVFFQEKIKMINEIITLVPLLESRIFSRVSNGLVLNTKDLYTLQSRVGELKHDIRSQIHTMKEHSWQDVAIRRANRLLRERINTWDTKCDEEIVKKFGKPIRLAKLEFVTVNPKVELLRYQMVTDKDRQVQEQKELDEKIRSLKKRLYNKVTQNTVRLQVKAELITKKRSIEDSMEFRCDSLNMCLKDEPRKERVRYQERRKLGHLLHQQVSVMHGCCEEMTRLWQRGTSTTCKMLPSSKHLSTATRKVRVAVPVSIHPPQKENSIAWS
ncbi:hypothetical protein ACOMHN_062851 [Nucella lapillus]